jgi:tRNA(Ile)-lysidine synthase
MSKNLTKKIQNFSFTKSLWKKKSRIIIGVSGGPDSVCLLDFLAKMKAKYELELIVAHVNYELRGKDSDKDEKFVRELAKKNGLRAEVLKPQAKAKVSENTLRNLRYSFFEKLREENNFDLIAVAHNQDDQAETVLMRLIRGASLKGLSGMKAKNDFVIRPLLQTTRSEILEYLRANKLKFRIDKTNNANVFLRNKIRNQLIPYIEQRFNHAFKKTLAESAAAFGDDEYFLNSLAKKYYQKGLASSAKKLLSLADSLQKRVLLLAIQEKRGDLENIESAHIQEIIKALQSTKNKNQVVLFKGLKLVRKGDKVVLV